MTNDIISVPFHNDTLTATLFNGVPYVAIKPICEKLGIDWNGQYQRIKRHPVLKQVMCMIHTTSAIGADGKSYVVEMAMLPINKLNGWLFGIDANRVNDEAQKEVILYQEECFDVLANHFMAKKPTIERPVPMTQPCHAPLMTKDMQRHVDHLVGLAAKNTLQTRHKIHKDLSAFFQAKKWFFIPCEKYPDVCAYFNVEPQYEQPTLKGMNTITIPLEEYEFLRKSCETPPDLVDSLTEFFTRRDARQYPTDSQVIIERERLAELSVLAKVATSGHGDIFVA